MYAFRLKYQFYMQLLCRSMAYMRKTNVCTLYSREALTQVYKIDFIDFYRFSSPGFSVLGQNNCREFKLTNEVISFYILSNKIQSSGSLVCMVLPTF